MSNVAAELFGTCGCGRPATYTSSFDERGSCNKYGRCPSYDEIRASNDTLQSHVKELRKALFLAERRCNSLHHGEKHRHSMDEPCPVEAIIEQAIIKTNPTK